MRLEDGAIALRKPIEEDVPAIVAACQDPEIPRWTRVPSPYTEDDAGAFVEAAGEHPVYAIVDVHTDELLGTIGARPCEEGIVDIGYWVKADARGRGVASRALGLLASWAVEELGAARVQLVTEPANVASQRVAEKAGFTREGVLRSLVEIKGTRRDCVMYSLLPEDL